MKDSAIPDAIVSDGARRLSEATTDRVAVRRAEITKEVRALYCEVYQQSGFLQRLWVDYRVRKEARQRLRKEFPGISALYLYRKSTRPNQALEPTSTAVTPPADAGDRASGTRGSP